MDSSLCACEIRELGGTWYSLGGQSSLQSLNSSEWQDNLEVKVNGKQKLSSAASPLYALKWGIHAHRHCLCPKKDRN